MLHAYRKSFDSQQAGMNLNFLMDIQSEIERLRAELAAVTAERDRMRARSVLIPESVQKIIDDYPAVCAERDMMRDALRRIDGMATTICMTADAGYGMKVETVMPIYETARAALEGVTEPASPWRDIESAPRDGTAVVGCSTYKNKSGNLCYNWIADGYFDERGDWYFANSDFAECAYPDVTDWMPLPEPPR